MCIFVGGKGLEFFFRGGVRGFTVFFVVGIFVFESL